MHPDGSSGVGHCVVGFGSANPVVERVMLAVLASGPARRRRAGTRSKPLAAPERGDAPCPMPRQRERIPDVGEEPPFRPELAARADVR